MHCLSRPMAEATPMIGQPIRRKEDPHFLRGGGRYVHDLTSPGLLHLAFVRSPYAHAAVHAIDATRARRLPGVVAVLAAADLPLSPIEPEFAGDEYHGAGWPPLAGRSEEHTSELQSRLHLVCRLLLEKKKKNV